MEKEDPGYEQHFHTICFYENSIWKSWKLKSVSETTPYAQFAQHHFDSLTPSTDIGVFTLPMPWVLNFVFISVNFTIIVFQTIQCNQCLKKFRAYRNLIIHKAHHDPLKINLKFSCEYCEIWCNTKYKLNRQLLTQTGVVRTFKILQNRMHSIIFLFSFAESLRLAGWRFWSSFCDLNKRLGCTMRFKLKSELRLYQDQHYLIQNNFAQKFLSQKWKTNFLKFPNWISKFCNFLPFLSLF